MNIEENKIPEEFTIIKPKLSTSDIIKNNIIGK